MMKNTGIPKGKENTRTHPDHPDLSRVCAGLRATPHPDPTRTYLDHTRTLARRLRGKEGAGRFPTTRSGKIDKSPHGRASDHRGGRRLLARPEEQPAKPDWKLERVEERLGKVAHALRQGLQRQPHQTRFR